MEKNKKIVMKEDKMHHGGFVVEHLCDDFYSISRNGVCVGYVAYDDTHDFYDFNIYVDQHYDKLIHVYKQRRLVRIISNCRGKK